MLFPGFSLSFPLYIDQLQRNQIKKKEIFFVVFVFFTRTFTSFKDTNFENLKIDDSVRITVKQTKHGPYAECLTPSKSRHTKPEVTPSPTPSL